MTHKIQFTYDEGTFETMACKTADGVTVTVGFDAGSPIYVDFDGHEIDINDDVLNGLYVAFKRGSMEFDFMGALDVVRQAEKELEEYREEDMQERDDDKRMERELSSPSMTGRI